MYIKIKKLFMLFAFCLSITGLQAKQHNSNYEQMINSLLRKSVPFLSIQQLKKELSKHASIIILDTREKEEYNVSHIKNAIWVGYKTFSMQRVKGISKNTEIVLYCSVGYRSEIIAEKLVEAGYKNVYNLYGALFEWINKGNPVYKNGKQTIDVHPFNKDWGHWLKKGKIKYTK